MLVSKPWTNRRGERQCFFNKSMDALSDNWYPINSYPIILQHPKGWTAQEINDIRQQWPQLPIYFSDIGQAFHQTDPPEHMEDENKPLSPLGYKKMCAFKTFGFLDAPYVSTHDLDYMFYLDDDSCLAEPIQYDVFQKMQQHKIAYAYKQLFLDFDYVVKGLTDFIKDYKELHKLQYANPVLATWLEDNGYLQTESSHWAFATNLEWVDLREYRRPNIMKFNKAVEASGVIFHRRWGDAPLRFVLAYLFWDNTQVMKLCSSYVHSMWNPSPSTCSSSGDQSPVFRDAVLTQLQNCTPKSTCN